MTRLSSLCRAVRAAALALPITAALAACANGDGARKADLNLGPGQDSRPFLDFPERMALVVDATGKAPKAMISEDAARAITAGAQPVSGADIILIYHGNLYVVPDRRMGDGKMASDMVRSSASNAGK